MNPPTPTRIRMLWTCAALSLVLLVATYAIALGRGTWPKGHPWHGIALAAMAAFFAVQTRLHQPGLGIRAAAITLPLIAMGAMAMAMEG